MKGDPKIEKFRHEREQRKALFAALGLRPLLMALNASMAVYILSVLAGVYHYSRVGNYAHLLVLPGILVAFMLFNHSIYARGQFGSSAFIVVVSLFLQYRHLLRDPFWALGSVARLLMVVLAMWIYLKMKDPRFSPEKNRQARRAPP